MNKEVLINPKTGKAKNCWSLDVPGLIESGWKRPGTKPVPEPAPETKQVTTTAFEPIEDKPKPRRTRKPKVEDK